MYQTKPMGSELHFHVNFSFCGEKLKWLLAGNVSENALKGNFVLGLDLGPNDRTIIFYDLTVFSFTDLLSSSECKSAQRN